MRLQGRIAIVTGAVGLGDSIAKKFVAEGAAKVIVADRGWRRRARPLLGAGTRCADVVAADEGDGRGAAQQRFGGLDILACTAACGQQAAETARRRRLRPHPGGQRQGDLSRREGSGAALQGAEEGRHPRNVASTAGVSPRPRLFHLGKQRQQGLVITATRSMAVSSRPFRHPRRGAQLGGRAKRRCFRRSQGRGDTPEIRARFLATIPIGRFSTPEDLGNAARFLQRRGLDDHRRGDEVDGGRCI